MPDNVTPTTAPLSRRAKLASLLLAAFPEVLLLAGGGCVVYGASLVYRPAGWLVAGALALAAGWRLGRG